MFKKETKAKLKQVWIDASPYVTVGAAFLGVIAVSYDKNAARHSEAYAELMKSRAENDDRVADAYIEKLRLEAEKSIVKKK